MVLYELENDIKTPKFFATKMSTKMSRRFEK